jgi:hypothetical protein
MWLVALIDYLAHLSKRPGLMNVAQRRTIMRERKISGEILTQ